LLGAGCEGECASRPEPGAGRRAPGHRPGQEVLDKRIDDFARRQLAKQGYQTAWAESRLGATQRATTGGACGEVFASGRGAAAGPGRMLMRVLLSVRQPHGRGSGTPTHRRRA
jgi:hypothetical protein